MPIWRLTVAQYHEMIQAGILTADDQLELLEGLLVTKMTKNPPHSLATQMVNSGVPIKQIADVLGHRSINTTAIYTKVDMVSLGDVALPFPGEKRAR